MILSDSIEEIARRSPLCRACNSLALVGSMRAVDFPCARFARISRNHFLVSFSRRFLFPYRSRRWYADSLFFFPSLFSSMSRSSIRDRFFLAREISLSYFLLLIYLLLSLAVIAAYKKIIQSQKTIVKNNFFPLFRNRSANANIIFASQCPFIPSLIYYTIFAVYKR